jgi:hypothetical protein
MDAENAWENIFVTSLSIKVRLLKLLLLIKFNLHLFILLYSDDNFISMSLPCTCISTVIVTDYSSQNHNCNGSLIEQKENY